MEYTDEQKTKIVNEICQLISEEGLSLRKAIIEQGSISRQTFYSWVDNDENKIDQYARAIQERADYYAEQILEIADDKNADAYIEPETGEVKLDGMMVQRSKLMVDTRKWLMSKMAPKKYGDKSTTVLEGGDKKIEIDFNE